MLAKIGWGKRVRVLNSMVGEVLIKKMLLGEGLKEMREWVCGYTGNIKSHCHCFPYCLLFQRRKWC